MIPKRIENENYWDKISTEKASITLVSISIVDSLLNLRNWIYNLWKFHEKDEKTHKTLNYKIQGYLGKNCKCEVHLTLLCRISTSELVQRWCHKDRGKWEDTNKEGWKLVEECLSSIGLKSTIEEENTDQHS